MGIEHGRLGVLLVAFTLKGEGVGELPMDSSVMQCLKNVLHFYLFNSKLSRGFKTFTFMTAHHSLFEQACHC